MTIFAWDIDETEPDGEQLDSEIRYARHDEDPGYEPYYGVTESCYDCRETIEVERGQPYHETARGVLICEVCVEERRFRASIDA